MPVIGVQVSETFFPMLAFRPPPGCLLAKDECVRGGRAAALLSHGFWQAQSGRDPGIVGRAIHLQATPNDINGFVAVVGVLPASLDLAHVGEHARDGRPPEARRLRSSRHGRNPTCSSVSHAGGQRFES